MASHPARICLKFALLALLMLSPAFGQTIAELNGNNFTFAFDSFTTAAGPDGEVGTEDDNPNPTVDTSGGILSINTTGNPRSGGDFFGGIGIQFDEIPFNPIGSSLVITASLPQPLTLATSAAFEVQLQDADPEVGPDAGDTFFWRFGLLDSIGFGAISETDAGGPPPQDGSTFTFTQELTDVFGSSTALFNSGLFNADGDPIFGNGAFDGLSGFLVQAIFPGGDLDIEANVPLIIDIESIQIVGPDGPSVGVDGDYNGDGLVDALDFIAFRESLGQTGPGLAADGNGDEVVDADDFQIFLDNFGGGAPAAVSFAVAPVAVPEPSSLLVGLAAMSTGAWLRRRRS